MKVVRYIKQQRASARRMKANYKPSKLPQGKFIQLYYHKLNSQGKVQYPTQSFVKNKQAQATNRQNKAQHFIDNEFLGRECHEERQEEKVESLSTFASNISMLLVFSTCFIFICINGFYFIALYVSHEKVITKIYDLQISQTFICMLYIYIHLFLNIINYKVYGLH